MRVRARNQGFALVIVLGIVAFVSVITYIMIFAVRVQSKVADNAIKQAQARYLAVAAVEKSMALLNENPSVEQGGIQPWLESSQFETQDLGPGQYQVAYQDAQSETGITYGLEDEAAKLNLNVATRQQLLLLPNMSDSLADCLLDWRDGDEMPMTFGAESEQYMALPQPYQCKNRPLGSLRELLMVQGFDPVVLYGEDTNKNAMLDPNEDDGETSEPVDDADGVLDEGILRYITVFSQDQNLQNDGSARVNIQSASLNELTSGLNGITSEQAQAIIDWRGSHPFKNIGELLDVTKATQGNSNQSNSNQNNSNQNSQGKAQGNSNSQQNQPANTQPPNQGNRSRGPKPSSTDADIDSLIRIALAPQASPGRPGNGQGNVRANNPPDQAPPDPSANQNNGPSSGGRRSTFSRPGNQNNNSNNASSNNGNSSDPNSTNNAPSGDKVFTTDQLKRWADAMTISSDTMLPGLINLNTASPEVLATVEGLTQDDVTQITLLRGAESAPFKSLGDLFNLPGMTAEKFKQICGKFTTRSNQFTVHAIGTLPQAQTRQQIEAVIERDSDSAHILYWRENQGF